MGKSLTADQKEWYFKAIEAVGSGVVSLDRKTETVTYSSSIASDESHTKSADPEELAHAVTLALLHHQYKYPLSALGHEIHFAHGSKGSNSDEVDILIKDEDGLPFAMFELKAAHEFSGEKVDAIRLQLFGTAPLVGSPRLLVYATVEPKGEHPKLKAVCIDYTQHKHYESWKAEGEPHSTLVPEQYSDLGYIPYTNQGERELDLNSTQADFRAVALAFHNEFFGEHPDNIIFVNLVKCLLAKIHDERTGKKGQPYAFQIFQKNGKPDSARIVFERVNDLYRTAYKRYIQPNATELDEINPKEFSEVNVKVVVQALQGISITKGAAKHGDVIGAFFEEILRSGFKQDRGMYFTHDNLVRFMIEAIDLPGLTQSTWRKSTHPDNRIPYVIDPACGSGTFLLHAMNTVTATVRRHEEALVTDHDAEQFYKARLSDTQPNYWAENFIYGFDPKFIMAITAKVNMVLHGDGSAHVFKDDAYKPLREYEDVRLRPIGEAHRSVPKSRYRPDLCESFDVIVSNPPFGITLPADVRQTLEATFSLPSTTPSEGLFVERCFQLLKPGGRLGLVVPESVLNASELAEVRLFLYRFFNIKSIVALPRNIFIDTPTLTSLLFAQKKTADEIEAWDEAWKKATGEIENITSAVRLALRGENIKGHTATQVADQVIQLLTPITGPNGWVIKGGRASTILRMVRDWGQASPEVAAEHFKDFIRTAGFRDLCRARAFSQVAAAADQHFPVFMVEEVGYKLSKRKEKARPNELCAFKGKHSQSSYTNLHVGDEECEVVIADPPETALDFIRSSVSWKDL